MPKRHSSTTSSTPHSGSPRTPCGEPHTCPIAHRADLLRSVTLPHETSLPLADLWDKAIRHDRRQEQELILQLRFMPELKAHFTPRQLARSSSDIERLIELAGDPDPRVIEALFDHDALFPHDPHHGFSAPPWAEPVTPAWGTQNFAVRPRQAQGRRRADLLLVNPALDSLNPYPLLRWLFDLPEPPDPRVHQFAFRQDWHSMADVRAAMPDFHRWYNHERRHSALGYATPWSTLTSSVNVRNAA